MQGMYSCVGDLLRAHDITGPEEAFSHNGYSGARISRITQDGSRYILKRLSLADDWIMRLTEDKDCREAAFATSPLARGLCAGVKTPYLGAALDGDGYAILMGDISSILLPDEGLLDPPALDLFLRRVAEMHAWSWEAAFEGITVPWCPIGTYLTLVGPQNGETLRSEGLDIGHAVVDGWARFFGAASPSACDLVRGLQRDPARLFDALEALPVALVHHDLKFANAGIEGDTLWLIDWAGVTRGPVALDLGWLLAVNSSRLPSSLDETLSRYGEHLRTALGERFSESMWQTQRAAAHICGLLMLGWGKADDPTELRWWCEGALDGRRVLDL